MPHHLLAQNGIILDSAAQIEIFLKLVFPSVANESHCQDFFKGALMPVASGRLIFYLNRADSGAGQQPRLLQKGLRSGFRKDEYEGYR